MDVSSIINQIKNLSLRTQYLIALFAGLLLPLSFAPIYAIPFVFISPLILFVLWLDKTPKIAFRLGFVFGFGFFSFGLSWVYIAIHVYGATAAWLAVIMTALFAAYLALFIALQGWLSAKLILKFSKSKALPTVIIFACMWVLSEWFRGWFLTGMPWLHLGYALPFSPFAGFAPLLGVYGISFVCILIVSALLLILLDKESTLRIKLILFIVCILIAGALLSEIEWGKAKEKTFSVSLVQGNAEQITKWDADKVNLRMETYAKHTREHWSSDVVLWPENAMTIFYHQLDSQYLLPLAKEAKANNTDLIVGLPVMSEDFDHYYSSMMSFSADDTNNTSYSGVFHKVHLVPFGEYVPLAGLIRGIVKFFDLPMSGFSAGKIDQPLLTMRGEPLATSVCYEDSFGEELIRQLPEATLLMNGSNNAWYGDSLAPHQHLQIAQMRAIETSRMLIRATTNGISAFVNHKGQILARSEQFKSMVLTHTAQPRTGATPYVRWGNVPIISLVFVLLFITLKYVNKAKNI